MIVGMRVEIFILRILTVVSFAGLFWDIGMDFAD